MERIVKMKEYKETDRTGTVLGAWDVGVSAAKYKVVASVVPVLRPDHFVHRRRRLTIEICPSGNARKVGEKKSHDKLTMEGLLQNEGGLGDNNRIIFRVFQPNRDESNSGVWIILGI